MSFKNDDLTWRIEMNGEKLMLAYLGGIIDGEGSIGIEHLSPTKSRKKDYYVCRLTVVNTNEDLMKLLIHFLRGSYNQRRKIEGRKLCYRWHVFGDDLNRALGILEPFILLKSKQLDLVMQYRDTVGKTGWNVSDEILEERKRLWLACKKLNKIGY